MFYVYMLWTSIYISHVHVWLWYNRFRGFKALFELVKHKLPNLTTAYVQLSALKSNSEWKRYNMSAPQLPLYVLPTTAVTFYDFNCFDHSHKLVHTCCIVGSIKVFHWYKPKSWQVHQRAINAFFPEVIRHRPFISLPVSY